MQPQLIIFRLLIGHTVVGHLLHKGLFSQALSIEEKLHRWRIAVNTDRDLSVDLNAVVIRPVPVGQDVYHGIVFHRTPLALIEIISILREAAGIHHTKLGRLGGPAVRRFAQIVKSGPDKESAQPFPVTVVLQCIPGGASPAHTVVIIGGKLHIFRMLSCMPVIFRMIVVAPAADGRGVFRTVDEPVGVVLMSLIVVGKIAIVKTHCVHQFIGSFMILIEGIFDLNVGISYGYTAAAVHLIDPGFQLCSNVWTFFGEDLLNLIAKRP